MFHFIYKPTLPDTRPEGPVSVGGSGGDNPLLYSGGNLPVPVSDRSQIREKSLELQKMCKKLDLRRSDHFTSGGNGISVFGVY